MNIKEIKEMIQLMNENNLIELELEKDGLKIRLKKTAAGTIESLVVQEALAASQASQIAREAVQKEEILKASAPAKASIKSPMVGTFYASPAPDAPPFMQVGQQVEIGHVVCIIEAMKLMNEIKSEVRGKISQVLVNNGDPVEFGQPLFLLE